MTEYARANLVLMNITTVGAGGPLTLGANVTGFKSVPAALDGKTIRYSIRDGAHSEVCQGVYTHSGTTVTRTTLASTNSDSPIVLSGSAEFALTSLAEDLDEMLAQGVHVVGYWPARALKPATTSGAAALATAESSSNKVNDEYLAFADGSTLYAGFSFRAPKKLDESAALDVEIEWMEAAGASAHVCRWQAEAQAQGDGDTIDAAWGTAVAADDPGTAGTRHFITLTGVVPAGAWAAGDKIHIRLARLGGHANDTLDAAAHLIGVTVTATVNAATDA